MNNSYIENLNNLADNVKPEKTYEEKLKSESNLAFIRFISDFKRAVTKIVENGSFTNSANQRIIKGVISSLFTDCSEWCDHYSLSISTSFPKSFSVTIANDISGSKYKRAVGPFYNIKHEMISEGAFFGLIKPKYEYVCKEETEKTTSFVHKFNNELKGFAKITRQYPLEYTKNFKNGDKSYWQRYDFEVKF